MLRADRRTGADKSELQLSTQLSLPPSFTSALCESVYSQVYFHTAFLANKNCNPHTYVSLLFTFSAFSLSKQKQAGPWWRLRELHPFHRVRFDSPLLSAHPRHCWGLLPPQLQQCSSSAAVEQCRAAAAVLQCSSSRAVQCSTSSAGGQQQQQCSSRAVQPLCC